jgi:ribokinase
MKVRVVGSFMYDLVASVARRPAPGESVFGAHLERAPGGKGFNQAVAAARAGAQVEMIGCLGSDSFAAEFRSALEAEGIESTHVVTADDSSTGLGLPVVEQTTGENSIVVFPGANMELAADHVPPTAEPHVLLLQLEVPAAASIAAAQLCRAAGGTVVFNPAPAVDAGRELKGHADGVVLNELEAEHFAPPGSPDDPTARASALLDDWAAAWVVVTLGERGALVVERGREALWLTAHRVDAIDTVGAGDAFCGTLGAGLAAGLTLHEAVTRGMAAGALAVTRRGGSPAMPAAAEVDDLLARMGRDAPGRDVSLPTGSDVSSARPTIARM